MMKNKRNLNILILILSALSIPLIAMQFSDQVNWGPEDFAVMAVMLLSTALIYEFGIRRIAASENRLFYTLALVAAFILLWAEMAVGIFGSPIAGS